MSLQNQGPVWLRSTLSDSLKVRSPFDPEVWQKHPLAKGTYTRWQMLPDLQKNYVKRLDTAEHARALLGNPGYDRDEDSKTYWIYHAYRGPKEPDMQPCLALEIDHGHVARIVCYFRQYSDLPVGPPDYIRAFGPEWRTTMDPGSED